MKNTETNGSKANSSWGYEYKRFPIHVTKKNYLFGDHLEGREVNDQGKRDIVDSMKHLRMEIYLAVVLVIGNSEGVVIL